MLLASNSLTPLTMFVSTIMQTTKMAAYLHFDNEFMKEERKRWPINK